MVNFLRLQYIMGNVTKEQLMTLVVKGTITQADYDYIISK